MPKHRWVSRQAATGVSNVTATKQLTLACHVDFYLSFPGSLRFSALEFSSACHRSRDFIWAKRTESAYPTASCMMSSVASLQGQGWQNFIFLERAKGLSYTMLMLTSIRET
jgi:hypothetical protein